MASREAAEWYICAVEGAGTGWEIDLGHRNRSSFWSCVSLSLSTPLPLIFPFAVTV